MNSRQDLEHKVLCRKHSRASSGLEAGGVAGKLALLFLGERDKAILY